MLLLLTRLHSKHVNSQPTDKGKFCDSKRYSTVQLQRKPVGVHSTGSRNTRILRSFCKYDVHITKNQLQESYFKDDVFMQSVALPCPLRIDAGNC